MNGCEIHKKTAGRKEQHPFSKVVYKRNAPYQSRSD
uniref:Uncharacterized protein n=1 Tax=virus sp. ctOZh10 TaxID=2828250 RepID=A0A8S5RBU3_9VIRU|nr:MAG TPA: hypothetical protein [virus sp. ctOZh10]